MLPLPTKRLLFFDRTRFFVIFLVICLHAAMTYMAYVPGWWYVTDDERRFLFTLVVLCLDVFIMPTMFFLAGYFALPSLAGRSSGEFLRRKLMRLGVPWVLGSVLVAPVLAYRSWISLGLPRDGFLRFLVHDFIGPVYQQGPYWFLGVLLMFFIVLAVFRPLLHSPGFAGRPEAPGRPGPGIFLLFWIASGVSFFLANLRWPLDSWVHPAYLFVFQPLRVVPYFLAFCLGARAWRQKWFVEGFYFPRPVFWIPLALVSGAAFLGLRILTDVQSSPLLKLSNALLHNGFCLAAMMALPGGFAAFRSACDPVGEHLGREAYGVYWVHLPVIMVLARLLTGFPLSPYVKFFLVVGPGTVLCVLLAGLMRRIPWLGKAF